jgi:3-methylcrotonyl-CoA carboxylase alpha subunit
MFNKILIANRGEIACRIIKTARKLGVRTVAVYSDADRNALHVAMADEAVHIGGSPSRESYLLGDRVIAAALQTGAEAVHPGYGFLSENAEFCQQCVANNIVFIGPPVGAIEAMGSKSAAKNIMEKAGVPLVPGYHGDDQNPELLKKAADDMGYPVLLKAVAGGGGKGMRQVWSADEFDQALAAAKRESKASFGNDDMLVEKYLTQPRHVEVQVFCDQQGNGVYLFERDCSVQRRHQKVIEEAPAPNMPAGLREKMGDTAVLAAQAIDYQGAGTVEFLLDIDGSYYFMEMNTRLQVEHPVTEMITGQDLVEWQLRVASGEPLPLQQQQLKLTGHAFEARIYAEDPDNDFLPVTGKLSYLQPPRENSHVRVDTGVIQGDEVSVFYDPMIAKLIVWDENRDRALARLNRALTEYHISGVTTNINFLYNLASSKPFVEADLDTGFIERHHDEIFRSSQQDIEQQLPLASLFLLLQREQINRQRESNNDPTSPWGTVNSWRMNAVNIHRGSIIINGESYPVPVEEVGSEDNHHYLISVKDKSVSASGKLDGNTLYADIDGHRQQLNVVSLGDSYRVFTEQGCFDFALAAADYGDEDSAQQEAGFTAPMNGTIVAIVAAVDQPVKAGDTLLIMEAMKMEQAIRAPADGMVSAHYFQPGDLVEGGATLLEFTPDAEESK